MPSKIQNERIARLIAAALELRDPSALQFILEDGVKLVYNIAEQPITRGTIKGTRTYFNAGTTGWKTVFTVPAGKRVSLYAMRYTIDQSLTPGAGLASELNVLIDSIEFDILTWTPIVMRFIDLNDLEGIYELDEGDRIQLYVSEAGSNNLLSYADLYYKEESL